MKVPIKESDVLHFHTQGGKPGKIEMTPTKPLGTQRDLSLAYSPGVAIPCLKIKDTPEDVYTYTSKGNMVAVISNGTAVLGLGNIGPLAAKPVMEGKSALFKRFADIDSFDLEVDTQDVDQFINVVRYLGPALGGINLEDIKAPECFMIEDALKELMDIPVFHDDQHGTAICVSAALINALHLTNKKISDVKIVINGAGAAAIACTNLMKKMGVGQHNITLVDRTGVVYKGRKDDSMNAWKEMHAVDTKARTLLDAVEGVDVLMGLSSKNAFTPEILKKLAKSPIIFAMANPDPEVLPEVVKEVRPDAIVATGRSDYPNQINNLLCFPYMFRGALDVRAKVINDEMKIAAAHALAELARQDVPEEVSLAYSGRKLLFGPEYIIPSPFDPRLISHIPVAVAKAAMDTKVARKPMQNLDEYYEGLKGRHDITYSSLSFIHQEVRRKPQRIIFAEGEEEKMIRAAVAFHSEELGHAILIGRKEIIEHNMEQMGITAPEGLVIHNASLSHKNKEYIDFLYEKLQRQGFLYRDCQRKVHQDRNIFSACMVHFGEADGIVTGLTRTHTSVLDNLCLVFDEKEDHCTFGFTIGIGKDRTVFIADTSIHEFPDPETLACIAKQTAAKAKSMGYKPRVAFVSYSTFGDPMTEHSEHVREAVRILDEEQVSFEYDGDMSIEVALNSDAQKMYPFCRLSGPANILVMPGIHSASACSQLLQEVAGVSTLGPVLTGLEKSVQIAHLSNTVNDLVNMAVLAAHDAIELGK